MGLKSLTYPILFILIIFLLMFIKILPLDTIPKEWIGPDVLFCVILTWCLRRPLSAPIVLIGLLFLLQDILFQRPPGLYAACATLVCEWCKRQVLRAEDFPFVAEWLTASIAIVAVFVLSQGIASLSLIATPPTVMFVKELMPTILTYPVVVVLLRYGFGLRTQQMSGFDASLGQEH